MAKSDYSSDIYPGGYSPLNPMQGYFQAGKFGMTTDPRNANILQEVFSKLSSGVKQVEIEAVSPDFLDSVPKQALKEVARLSKLTGIDVSLHGPVMDVSGISQQGFSEVERETAERKIIEFLKRAKELNPEGNIPVNFHSAEGIPGAHLIPPSQREKEGTKYKRMVVINRDTGRLNTFEGEKEFRPGGEQVTEVSISPEERLNNWNSTEWKNSMFQIEVNRENAERIMENIHPIFISQFAQLQTGQLKPENLNKDEITQIKKISSAFEFIDQARASVNSHFSRAYEIAKKDNNQEQINLLNALSKRYGELVGMDGERIKAPEKYFNPKVYSDALYELTRVLEATPPKAWVPIEDFALEKSSQTFGNAAYKAYKDLKGKNVPLLVIENPPAGFALSTGEDIKNMVEKSREQFVKKAVEGGMSKDYAEEEAKKLIGATWDVGHINMLRKYGYSEKEIVEETKKVAPFVRHVHLSDNFGFEHTELPMGMGNVPLKEMMEKLGENGYDARKIIEAAQWWQHFKTPPFQETLEAVGSPLYSMKMAPYWSQAPGLYQGYSSGYGAMLPQINYETFAAGFSRLPSELGGSVQGAQGSRMSGRGME